MDYVAFSYSLFYLEPYAMTSSCDFTFSCSTCIDAVGTVANPIVARRATGVNTNKWGYSIVDNKTCAATRAGILAGGDIVHGAATVIRALGDGKKAAKAIDDYLSSGGSLRAAKR